MAGLGAGSDADGADSAGLPSVTAGDGARLGGGLAGRGSGAVSTAGVGATFAVGRAAPGVGLLVAADAANGADATEGADDVAADAADAVCSGGMVTVVTLAIVVAAGAVVVGAAGGGAGAATGSGGAADPNS